MDSSDARLIEEMAELKAQLAHAEQALAHAKQLETGLLQAVAPDMLFRFDRNGTVLRFQGSAELLMVPTDEVVGTRVTESPMPPQVAQEILQCVRRCIDTRNLQVCRFELNLPAGVRQQEARFVRLSEKEVLALVQDMTGKHERGRAAHRALADELESILATLRDYVWSAIVDAQGRLHCRYYSQAVERLTGRPPAFYLEGRDRWRSTVHEDDLARVDACFAQAITAAAVEAEEAYRIVRPNGEVRWMNERLRCHREGDELLITGVVTDITEARLLNERLRESQKLEALGVLAGGIAHDFNNILVGVLGGAETASECLPASHPAQEKLTTIVESSTRAAELCQQMLTYAGKANVSIQPLNVAEVLHGMSHLLNASLSPHVALHLDTDEALPWVQGDAPQVRQLLLNLVKNASDAAAQRKDGRVDVRIESRHLTASELTGWVAGSDAAPGDYLVLVVSDNGPGVDSYTRERMFEPFFTTKQGGHGLGLAAALGIIRAHRGALHVGSTLGEGTEIRVALPAAMPQHVSEQPTEGSSNPAPNRGGTVLVIDDEETVLFIATTILESDGYRVQTASSGREGIELFKTLHREVRLVVLDMTMPGLTGGDVYRALREVDPEVPVLLSSGYSEQDALGEITQQGQVSFLHKPYRAADLRAAVNSAVRDVPGS